MNRCIEHWKSNDDETTGESIWNTIEQKKPIYVEPETKEQFLDTIGKYYATVRENAGAIFMGVQRAKISEGIDFTDIYGRAIVIIGIPFAPYSDPKIQNKMKQFDERKECGSLYLPSGEEWHTFDAIRATNQSIGRIIQHKNDYGCIFLCDHRFNRNDYQQYFPQWIQTHLKNQKFFTFADVLKDVECFFEQAEEDVTKF